MLENTYWIELTFKNISDCNYDGGDCCGDDINISYCYDCTCNENPCEGDNYGNFFSNFPIYQCEKIIVPSGNGILFSSDRENLFKFEAEGREFAKFLRSLQQFIQTLKGQNKFW